MRYRNYRFYNVHYSFIYSLLLTPVEAQSGFQHCSPSSPFYPCNNCHVKYAWERESDWRMVTQSTSMVESAFEPSTLHWLSLYWTLLSKCGRTNKLIKSSKWTKVHSVKSIWHFYSGKLKSVPVLLRDSFGILAEQRKSLVAFVILKTS